MKKFVNYVCYGMEAICLLSAAYFIAAIGLDVFMGGIMDSIFDVVYWSSLIDTTEELLEVIGYAVLLIGTSTVIDWFRRKLVRHEEITIESNVVEVTTET